MKFKNQIKTVLSLIVCLAIFSGGVNFSYGENVFDVKAKSALLMDFASGEIIYDKNSHQKLNPASITKIMVLLLAMEAIDNERIKLDDEMIISSNASGMGGSQIFLEEGETQKVEDIIRAICLRSANDGAVALGEYIAGSEELFIKMMNDRAKELGMENTQFMNITGLDKEGHYTSAYDISIMSRELLKHPKIHDWLTLWMSEIKVGKKKDDVQVMVNTNRLVHDYKGTIGIKTGYTSKAGHCLSAAATRGDLTLISVVLGCENSKIRFAESKKLLDYGFANYDSVLIAKRKDIITELPIAKGKVDMVNILVKEDTNILIKKGQSNQIEKEVILPDFINAPIMKNEKIGELIIKNSGKEIKRVDLVVEDEVLKATFLDILRKIIINTFEK